MAGSRGTPTISRSWRWSTPSAGVFFSTSSSYHSFGIGGSGGRYRTTINAAPSRPIQPWSNIGGNWEGVMQRHVAFDSRIFKDLRGLTTRSPHPLVDMRSRISRSPPPASTPPTA
jgi:hypothetical protein